MATKPRKKPDPSSPTSMAESLIRASFLTRSLPVAGRFRSPFVASPTSNDTVGILTASKDASLPTKSLKKKTKQLNSSGTDSLPKAHRKDEIRRALTAQISSSPSGGSPRMRAKADISLSPPVELVDSDLERRSSGFRERGGGTKTFSSIIRAASHSTAKQPVNAQSTESLQTTTNGKKATTKKRKRISSKNTSDDFAESENHAAVSGVAELLGRPVSIQSNLGPKLKSAKGQKNRLSPVKNSKVGSKTSIEMSKEGTKSNSLPVSRDTPEGDDLFFPSALTPKHEYPVLEDCTWEESHMEAIKYVRNALAVWLNHKDSMEAAAAATGEEAADSINPAKMRLNAESKTSSAMITPGTSESISDIPSPAQVSTGKGQNAVIKPKSGNKRSKAPRTTNLELTESGAPTVESSAAESGVETPQLDENGNQTSEPVIKLSSAYSDFILAPNGISTVTTQTDVVGNSTSVQTGRSLIDLYIATRGEMSSLNTPDFEANLICIDSPSRKDDDKAPPISNSHEVSVVLNAPPGLHGGLNEKSASSISRDNKMPSPPVMKTSVTSVGTCETLTLQSSKDPEFDDAGNNNLIAIHSASRMITKEREGTKLETHIEPLIPVEAANIDESIGLVGLSRDKTVSEIQATDDLYSRNCGDHKIEIGEVKCYEQDSHQTIVCQPHSPSVHTVGVSGISKTWSFSSYNHPIKSQPLKSLTPMHLSVGYSSSTQTIDESTAECQVGRSFTSPRHPGGEDEDNEHWEDDDPRMHAADEILDSESLLEIPETIAKTINELDINTNLEKMSDTISSTFRAMTDLIFTEVTQSYNCNDNETVEDKDQPLVEVSVQAASDNFLCEKKLCNRVDENLSTSENGTFCYDETSIGKMPVAILDPRLSETSM